MGIAGSLRSSPFERHLHLEDDTSDHRRRVGDTSSDELTLLDDPPTAGKHIREINTDQQISDLLGAVIHEELGRPGFCQFLLLG